MTSTAANTTRIDTSIKRGMYSGEFAKGRRAAKAGKSRFDCPYNGADLRDGWFAGFDSVRAEAEQAAFERTSMLNAINSD